MIIIKSKDERGIVFIFEDHRNYQITNRNYQQNGFYKMVRIEMVEEGNEIVFYLPQEFFLKHNKKIYLRVPEKLPIRWDKTTDKGILVFKTHNISKKLYDTFKLVLWLNTYEYLKKGIIVDDIDYGDYNIDLDQEYYDVEVTDFLCFTNNDYFDTTFFDINSTGFPCIICNDNRTLIPKKVEDFRKLKDLDICFNTKYIDSLFVDIDGDIGYEKLLFSLFEV